MKPITKVITDEKIEQISIHWDNTRFGLIAWRGSNSAQGLIRKIILNPREAQEIANFINENNGEYQRELTEKKLQENIERLG